MGTSTGSLGAPSFTRETGCSGTRGGGVPLPHCPHLDQRACSDLASIQLMHAFFSTNLAWRKYLAERIWVLHQYVFPCP